MAVCDRPESTSRANQVILLSLLYNHKHHNNVIFCIIIMNKSLVQKTSIGFFMYKYIKYFVSFDRLLL